MKNLQTIKKYRPIYERAKVCDDSPHKIAISNGYTSSNSDIKAIVEGAREGKTFKECIEACNDNDTKRNGKRAMALSDYTDKQLVDELIARGYQCRLYKMQEVIL